MNIAQKNIYSIIEKDQLDWSNLARKKFLSCWRKTLIDDKKGIISLLPDRIFDDLKVPPKPEIKNGLKFLGAASLLFWTTANLQDDLSDEETTPKEYIPLSNICLRHALLLCNNFAISHPETNKQLNKLLQTVDETNLKELCSPKNIPSGELAPANKSLFLLAGPLLLVSALTWSKTDQENFLNAGKYLLSAKQLADDVYDYQDDWKKGRRNFAHRHLTKLPTGTELPLYFQRQAWRIKALCLKSRSLLKTVSALKTGNCFDDYLIPLEANCERALANLKFQAQANYNHSKKTRRLAPRVISAPARNL